MEEHKKAGAQKCRSCVCEKTETTRRGFLQFTGGAVTAATIAATSLSAIASEGEAGGGVSGFFKSLLGICRTPELDPGKWSLSGNQIQVRLGEIPELKKPNGAVYLQAEGLDVPVLIVKGEDGRHLAFSNKCTHMGRKLDPVPGKETLRCCSLGHATYDFRGHVLSGPADNSIAVYEVTPQGDDLVIQLKVDAEGT